MTVSVCVGTYNGEKYIRQQLESIKNQTLQPDEVVICDDGSSDNTVEIIRAFIRERGLQDGQPDGLVQDGEKGEGKEKGRDKDGDIGRGIGRGIERDKERDIDIERGIERERERERERKRAAVRRQGGQGCVWKLAVNEKNLGYPACFYHAMSLCSGDIVFLSDQDDIWDTRKLEKMCTVFSEQDGVKALVCKFGLIDGEGKALETVMKPTYAGGRAELRKVSVHDVFYKGEWPGMVMAYRREWYERRAVSCRECISAIEIPHDLLVGVWAAEEGAFRQLDEELAWHRRHDNNAGLEEHKIRKLLNKERKLREIEVYLRYLEAFKQESLMVTQEGQSALEEKLQSMSGRYEALRSGKIGSVLGNALKNRKNVRLATVVCDLIICHQRVMGKERG